MLLVRQRVAIGGGAVSHPAGGLVAAVHVGELLLDRLEGGDRLAELDSLLGVLQGELEAASHRPEGAAGQRDALGAEAGGQNGHALVQAADEVLFGKLHVFEGHETRGGGSHAPLLDLLTGPALLLLGVAHEGGDAVGALFGVRLGVKHHEVGQGAVGDEDLAAVDDPLVALLDGLRRHAHGVGAGVGLGDAEAADVLAGAGLGQDFQFLLFRRVAAEVVEAQRLAGADGHGEGVAHAGDRLIGQQGFNVAHGGSAVLLLEHDSVDTQVACLLEETLGHHIQFVRMLHLGLEPGKRPFVNAVLEHLLFIGEIEIQRHNQLPPFLKFGPKARMTDFPVQAHSVSLMNQLARGDPLSLCLSQAWQKNGGEGCLRADFQVPNALDKTREIYINAVVLSRLKTNFRAKAGVFYRCIRCRAAMPHDQGRFRPA